jgi:hypothetical protein
MRSIQNYHMDTQGWSDIAYNLAVCTHGYIYEGRGKGKGSGANGTSDANHNYPSVCALVGENDPQPSALDDGIADAVEKLRGWGVGSTMKGHRDFVSTACPGSSIYSKMKDGRYSEGNDDVSKQDVVDALNSADGQKALQKAIWSMTTVDTEGNPEEITMRNFLRYTHGNTVRIMDAEGGESVRDGNPADS